MANRHRVDLDDVRQAEEEGAAAVAADVDVDNRILARGIDTPRIYRILYVPNIRVMAFVVAAFGCSSPPFRSAS